ncbi:MAG: hypothetical protein PHY83_03340 [Bacilli bacterium]|nr:hypothetical protein [Bacilli bacterium]
MNIKENFELENFQKIKKNGITIALPVLMDKSKYNVIYEALDNYREENVVSYERVYTDPNRGEEFKLVDGIVEGSKNSCLSFYELSIQEYKEKELEKIILQCLSRCYASLSSAQLLFNFKYYIEYVSILRIIYEQCAYVINLADNGIINKGIGPQKCIQKIKILDINGEKKYHEFYGVLSECAHLYIFKEKGKLDISKIDDVFVEDDKIAIKSTRKTINNYSVFKKVYDIFVDTCKYVYETKFKDNELMKKAVEQLRNNRCTIKAISEKGTFDFKTFIDEYCKKDL